MYKSLLNKGFFNMEVKGLTNISPNYYSNAPTGQKENRREEIKIPAEQNDKKSVARLYTEQQKLSQDRVEKILNQGNNIKEAYRKMASHYSAQYMHSGKISQNIKLYKMAQSSYEKAFTWDPKNIDALEEAARIRMLA
jgi:hypothetical protein